MTAMTESPPRGANCRSGCRTKDHATFAECARGIRFSTRLMNYTAAEREKAADNEAYRRLRKDGFEPARIEGAAELERRQAPREVIEDRVIWDDEG